MFCPHCGAENPDGVKFCSGCGQSLEAATQQPAQEAQPAQNVQPAQPVQPVQPVQPLQGEQTYHNNTGWKKWVLLVGSIFGALAVVVSFIFTFLIGAAMHTNMGNLGDLSSLGIRTQWGISYFFGGAFEDLADTVEAIGNGGSFDMAEIMYTMITAAYGALIFIGFIIAMIVVFIKALIRYIKHFKGTDVKGVAKLTTGIYFFYALGASLIVSMFTISAKESGLGVKMVQSISYNGATVAGLALGGVFLGIFLACKIAVRGKDLIKLPVLIPGILSVCTLVLTAVLWSLSAGPLVGVAESEYGMSVSSMFSYLPLIQNLHIDSALLESGLENGSAVMEALEAQVAALGVSVSAWVVLLIQIIMVSKLATQSARKVENLDNKDSYLKFGIVQFVFSLLVLVMGIVLTGDDYKEALFRSSEANVTIGPVIGVFVVSLLVLGLTIANKIVTNKFAYAPAPAPVQTMDSDPQV